eukprot:12413594-Karenia_brevis.AAC.1
MTNKDLQDDDADDDAFLSKTPTGRGTAARNICGGSWQMSPGTRDSRWTKLEPSWGQVRAKLGPSWGQVGSSWHQVGGNLGPSWGQ